jgi:hypothetical protein
VEVDPAFSCFWMPLIEGGLGGFGYMEFSWNNQKTIVRLS